MWAFLDLYSLQHKVKNTINFDLMSSVTLTADDKYHHSPESLIESDQLEVFSGLLRFKGKSHSTLKMIEHSGHLPEMKSNQFQKAIRSNESSTFVITAFIPKKPKNSNKTR